MSLELDERQRAMLDEMGVRVWLPSAAVQPPAIASATQAAALRPTQDRPTPPHPVATPAVSLRTPEPAVALSAGPALDVQTLGWPELAEAAAACQACGLCQGRSRATLTPPEFPAQTDWMFVGDPPDEQEDQIGQPFAAQAGQLMDNMLKAVGAQRGHTGAQGAYLTNIVKCRPPLARLPHATELAQCEAYLQREIALVQPRVIVAMGRFATQVLLREHPEQTTQPLGRQRANVYRYRGTPVVVTYHPRVLLRNSADKAKAWADLCLAMDDTLKLMQSLPAP